LIRCGCGPKGGSIFDCQKQSGTFDDNFQEGLARNYWEPYEACTENGTGTCHSSKDYQFMAGYQGWFRGDHTPTQRAEDLLGSLANDSYREDLENDIGDILDNTTAKIEGWIDGKMGNRPWQWHNMLGIPSKTGTGGKALGWVYFPTAYGNYFWFFTGHQDWCKNHPNSTECVDY